jgi:PTS system N-acetylglucosamine-specific IIA component
MVMAVHAPVSGQVVDLDAIADPVFAEAMIGPGLALNPDPDGTVVLAPVDGVVLAAAPHAFIVEHPVGRSVLVHLGLDTVNLRGKGFLLRAGVGDVVTAGQAVVTWSPHDLSARGYDPVVAVVVLDAAATDLDHLTPSGTHLSAGDRLYCLT